MKGWVARSLGVLILIGESACASTADPKQMATAEAIGRAVRSTATVEAAMARRPQEAVGTAQAQATDASQAAAATRSAQNDQANNSQAATQVAQAPIQAELHTYGVDPSQGKLGWIHPPVTLEVNGYKQYAYSDEFLQMTAADLVISADITWNTQYGTSGCGFVLRSDGKRGALNQYLVIATRAASGHVIFATMANGQVVGGRDMYAYGKDKSFRADNDATNRLTVVARGEDFTVYVNGVKIGEVNPTAPAPRPDLPPLPDSPLTLKDPRLQQQYQQQLNQVEQIRSEILGQYLSRQKEAQSANRRFESGIVTLGLLSESGHTSCRFDNTWLWLIH